jgi:hypothetical protein
MTVCVSWQQACSLSLSMHVTHQHPALLPTNVMLLQVEGSSCSSASAYQVSSLAGIQATDSCTDAGTSSSSSKEGASLASDYQHMHVSQHILCTSVSAASLA